MNVEEIVPWEDTGYEAPGKTNHYMRLTGARGQSCLVVPVMLCTGRKRHVV